MSAYNPMYNPAGYLTNVYGRPVPENPYAPFYPGPPTDQYVPHHWTPDPNQAFYTPSISQGIPPGWRHPPMFSANGNNPRSTDLRGSAALGESLLGRHDPLALATKHLKAFWALMACVDSRWDVIQTGPGRSREVGL
ncbi:hypothetical protein J132_11163 [Termitomyces sp. J132]|nr:hypothetical protein J132_11163 [Termitomyces sp. J132]